MKLPLLSGRQVHAALGRLGFVEIDRRGSHVRWSIPTAGGLSSLFIMKWTATR